MQGRFFEMIRQKAEAWNVGGPAEPRGDELADGDFQGIARFSAFDMDGPCNRVDLGEVKLDDIAYGRVATELFA